MTDLSLEGFTTVSLSIELRVEISITETELETECLITSDYEIVCVVHICVACAVLKKFFAERIALGELLPERNGILIWTFTDNTKEYFMQRKYHNFHTKWHE